jgi:hypothetical protein
VGFWHFLIDVRAGGGDRYQLTATVLPEDPPPFAATRGQLVVSNFPGSELMQISLDGDRAVQSSALRGSGADLVWPEGMALDWDGTIVVANAFGANLLRVEPESGERSVLSGCTDPECIDPIGSGPDFLAPRFVALARNGDIWVADRAAPGVYAVLRVDRLSGDREVISGCTHANCNELIGEGPAVDRLFGIAIERGGDILIADSQAVLRIDPATGDRDIVSGCTDAVCSGVVGQGPDFGEPGDLVIDAEGVIYVSYQLDGFSFGAIRRVDPVSGERTTISGCTDEACSGLLGAGPRFGEPLGLAFDLDGNLLVCDLGLNAVVQVDLESGARTIVTGCSDERCASEVGAGPALAVPIDVVVLPELSASATRGLATSLLCALAAAARRRRALSAARR